MAAKKRAIKAHVFAKESNGHYVEPQWCSLRLFQQEAFHGHVWDPCCGFGNIVKSARALGKAADGTDLVNRGFCKGGTDFLAPDAETVPDGIGFKPVNLVFNPPFDHIEAFARKALTLADGKVALIVPVARLNAAHWLREVRASTIYLLTPRPSMPPGSYLKAGKKAQGGTKDFCWLVLDRFHVGAPRVLHLHRDEVIA